jgi:LysM repeat protein
MTAPGLKDANKNVSKIVIQAFKDKLLTQPANNFAFTIPINPETLSQKFELIVDSAPSIGGEKSAAKYGGTASNELRLEFYLDNTHTVAGNTMQGIPVPDQLGLLLTTVHKMDGENHKPYYLKIAWGSAEIFGEQRTTFDCLLKSLDVQYVLFKPDGEPLRAKVSATFVEHIADEKRVNQEGKKSPDLTHTYTMTPADRLWLMTHKNYGQPAPLLQVTRANNLTSFRQIPPGTHIVLPPYDKTQA